MWDFRLQNKSTYIIAPWETMFQTWIGLFSNSYDLITSGLKRIKLTGSVVLTCRWTSQTPTLQPVTSRSKSHKLSAEQNSLSRLSVAGISPLWLQPSFWLSSLIHVLSSPNMRSAGVRRDYTTEATQRGELTFWDDPWLFKAAGGETPPPSQSPVKRFH